MKTKWYPRFEHAAKRLLLQPAVWWRYGTLRPARARLHGCDTWLHIDPADPCAYKKVVLEPLRGIVSPNLIFWRELNAHLQPRLAVDVGVNYGECLFGTRYAPHTRVFGFEANPRLMPLLERSRAEHPERDAIRLVHGLVSDRAAEDVPFRVNLDWSGGSSAVPGLNAGSRCEEFKLPARTIDSQIPGELAEGADLVFKMDIEGYESLALRGFTRTLDAVRQAVGCAEFNVQFIRATGEDPTAYFRFLAERFEVFRFVSARQRTVCRLASLADVPASHGNPDAQCTDVILVSRKNSAGWLPSGWREAKP